MGKKVELVRKLKKAIAKEEVKQSGVVIVRNLPHRIFPCMFKKFFNILGNVKRVRFGKVRQRPPKTDARSKNAGYGKRGPRKCAFVEYESQKEAKVTAIVLNKYRMFAHKLRANYISPNIAKEKCICFKKSVRSIRIKYDNQKYDFYRYKKKIQATFRKLEGVEEKLGINFAVLTAKPKKGEDIPNEPGNPGNADNIRSTARGAGACRKLFI